jgi:hypothetical protein
VSADADDGLTQSRVAAHEARRSSDVPSTLVQSLVGDELQRRIVAE